MRLTIIVIMLLVLTACTTSVLAPPSQLVEKAIALQLEKTQQQLNQQLDLDFQGFKINHLSITQEKPLTIQNLITYQVRGTYDLTFKLPKRKLTQANKPFEVYLQLQKEGKTWRLLLPEQSRKDTEPVWHSYLIQ
ncbi:MULTISPECIES: hypothetical protein [Fischerella]|uniref:DUF4878 domain-containing protein n=1 Tax=Fischerella muscicola CCMEE 5323 TaxID=2019572 RepID=A0A2N6K462_FISMU|nr:MULTISPECIES: hypothetical protein [Fischerella]MBD2429948.1 hypothetical protein [Fischerella sp. FACHB-380]PLZ90430.1 hypothetical protein CEN44_10720 [Fischerella muscicola CCMEE 5323]